MHGRICLAGLAVLLVSGCAQERTPVAVPRPVPAVVAVPAASAGGACRLLDFAVVEQATGIRFDVAAASQRGDTRTCVLRAQQASLPDLTLAVTDTSVDVSAFTADLVPDGARKVPGLGQRAYRRTVAPAGKNGPFAEVGWLAGGRLGTLRYTHPSGADRAAAEESTSGLVELAKGIDTSTL